jgi:uncharacterized protein (DUF302 family)
MPLTFNEAIEKVTSELKKEGFGIKNATGGF